ncbi:MAG: hypothetical protein GY829_14625 [Gammaproteobacteria bacterium]|nr:hypothetical protein [Gammaproteobacteria bacterium]
MTDTEFYTNAQLLVLCWLMLVIAWVFWGASMWQRHDHILGPTLFVAGFGAYMVGAIILIIIKGYF